MAKKREAGKNIQKPTSATALPTTADLKLSYARASHSVDLLCASEEARRERCQALALQQEVDNIQGQLWTEQERAEDAECHNAESQHLIREMEDTIAIVEEQLRLAHRDLSDAQAESKAMQAASADSTKLLTEKLALSRELASMKPELEHLRSQDQANANLLSEKLALERQLRQTTTELDDSKKTISRLESVDKDSAQSAEENQRLRDELSKSQRESAKVQRQQQSLAKESSSQVERLRDELEAESARRQKLEEELAQAQEQAAKRAQHESTQVADLQAHLSKEQKDYAKLQETSDTALAHAEAEFEAQRAALDDKLSQFRTKLKSTKEKLRDTEVELKQARSDAASARAATSRAQTKRNPRKRTASQLMVDPDAAIGTPGDAQANKRAKRASSVVGEKSTFSVTPFLNQTSSVSVAPEGDRQLAAGQDEVMDSIESPIQARAAPVAMTTSKAPSILAPSSANKINAPIPATATGGSRKRPKARPTLEQVAEESSEAEPERTARVAVSADRASNEENDDPTSTLNIPENEKAKQAQQPSKPKLQVKPRKSLASFNSFRDGSVQPDVRQFSREPSVGMHKKKRKLLGNRPKTIFDEEDEAADDGGAVNAFGSFGGGAGQRKLGGLGGGLQQRAFGALGGGGVGVGRGLLARNRGLKEPLRVEDGFAFSPLKKERRTMREASRAASELPA